MVCSRPEFNICFELSYQIYSRHIDFFYIVQADTIDMNECGNALNSL